MVTGVPRLAPGSRVGDYEIERFLRVGSRAAIYRATQPALDRAVSLHVAYDAPESTPAEAFLADARRLAALAQPNLVPIYATGTDDTFAFVATGVPEGRPLA